MNKHSWAWAGGERAPITAAPSGPVPAWRGQCPSADEQPVGLAQFSDARLESFEELLLVLSDRNVGTAIDAGAGLHTLILTSDVGWVGVGNARAEIRCGAGRQTRTLSRAD